MDKRNANRDKANGRYSYGDHDRLCVCGARLGAHTAEWPHDLDDADCTKFKPAKVAS